MLPSKADRGWESKIQDIFSKLEGENVVIQTGLTDEGDRWYSGGDTHLAIGKDLGATAVYHQWELVAAFMSLEICHSTLFGKTDNPVN